MNDLKLVEKIDFDRFNLIRTQNNYSLMANMMKRLYYYKELKWFLYYLDNYENTKVEWTDRLFINGCDFDQLINHGEDNIYEMNDYEMVEGDYNISLSLVGVTIDDENYFKYLQNEFGNIRISNFELVFAHTEEFSFWIREAIYYTDCSEISNKISSFKTSKVEALGYVKRCARACGVVPSLVPRGDLFFKLIYRNNSLDWKLCKWMYRNSVIPIFEVLNFMYRSDIMCYCFDQIISLAKFYYLEEKTFNTFQSQYATFRKQPKVVECVDRLIELFSIVVEKGKEEELFNSTQPPNVLKMAQLLDKKTITRYNYLRSSSLINEDASMNFSFYSWENDFIYAYFQRKPKNIVSLQLPTTLQNNSKQQLVDINTFDLEELDSYK
ncbi:predicted protein [Naegleria gruberi]|uniref:Predicted protein n=1 Tax=Naegleria gruberi TaxID=5762 RepID=D2VCH6_NAEGR|nr:uncharacterized protein NAEGRDRAFT_66574 [Naegleria gruberi]EFC45312.1 predicted protein [Naegleria gruberi]|eukprot:XP_002678056.1 predicted protein [Naegleria gruberi strain NEG-M]